MVDGPVVSYSGIHDVYVPKYSLFDKEYEEDVQALVDVTCKYDMVVQEIC
jgi:hypothetical protein